MKFLPLLSLFGALVCPATASALGPQPLEDPRTLAVEITLSGGLTEPSSTESRIPGGQGSLSVTLNDAARPCGSLECTGTWLQLDLQAGAPWFRARLGLESPSLVWRQGPFFITPLSVRGLATVQASHTQDSTAQLGNTYGLGSVLVGLSWSTRKPLVLRLSADLFTGPEGGYLYLPDVKTPFAGWTAGVRGRVGLLYPMKHQLVLEGTVSGHINFLAWDQGHALTSEASLTYKYHPSSFSNGNLLFGFKTYADWMSLASPTGNPLALYAGLFFGIGRG